MEIPLNQKIIRIIKKIGTQLVQEIMILILKL